MREYKRLLYSSADRRFRKREDVVVLDSSPCDYEDHPVTRRDESDIAAVQLAALHHGTHCVGFLTSRRKSAGIQQLLGLIQTWYTTGTYDQLTDFGRPQRWRGWRDRYRAMWMPITIQTKCTQVLGGLETLCFRLCNGTLLNKSKSSGRPSQLNDASVDARGILEVLPPPEARLKLQWRMVQGVSKLTRGVVEDVEKETRPVAGRGPAHGRNGVGIGRNVGCLRRRCGGSHGIWRFWCGAGVRVCHTFSAPS